MADQIALPKRPESDAMNFRAGGVVTLKKDFLESALSMLQPMNRRWWIRGRFNVSTSAGTGSHPDFKGGLLSHIYDNIVIKDGSGQRLNLSGGELRAVAQEELGIAFRDPADIAPSTTLDVEFRLPVLFTLADRAGDPDDSAMLLSDFYSAGEMTISFRSGTILGGDLEAPALTVNSGVVTIEADVRDYGAMQAPSRLSWESTALLNKDSSYSVNGKLRAALLYVGRDNEESGTPWDSAGETLESRSLLLISTSQTHLIEAYLEEGYHKDEIDMVANNYLLPLFFPSRGGKISETPIFDNVHIKFSQSLPEGSTVVRGIWTQRSSRTLAQAFRGVPLANLGATIKAKGHVPGLRGNVPLSAFPPDQRKYMPIRIPSEIDSSAVTPVGQSTR
jgi:hypothetical protein